MSAAAPAPIEGTSVPGASMTLTFGNSVNQLCSLALFVGQRVRVELENASATPRSPFAPLSTTDELLLTSKATIRYLGPVSAAKDPLAPMVGIEWDEPGKGKNDGSVGGKRYFECVKGQGSFIHPARIRVGPTSLTAAIAEKYETRFKADASTSLYLVAEHNKPNEAGAAAANVTANGPPGAAPARHIPVVFQGEEYMQGRIAQKLQTLVDMTLTQSDISLAFDPTADQQHEERMLQTKIANCQTLDVTDNLFRDWKETAKIVQTLPKLRLLALSSNAMDVRTLREATSSSLAPVFTSSFSGLEVLVLNTVPDAWTSVLTLALGGALSDLHELHLCKNGLKSISAGLISAHPESSSASHSSRCSTLARAFPKLTTLELSFNEIEEWREVRLLERLPKLQRILLNSNLLTEITYGTDDEPSSSSSSSSFAPWATLCSLGVNSNRLRSFSSVHSLTLFPALKELRLRDNPDLEEATMRLNAGGSAASSSSSATASGGESKVAEEIKKVLEKDEATKIIPAEALNTNLSAPASSSGFLPTPQSASLLRLQLVARLPALHTLNRSRVSERERMDAEKYYLLVAFQSQSNARNTAAAAASSPASPAAETTTASQLSSISALFPRYSELVTLHGDPAATVSAMAKQLVEPAGSTLASKLVEVRLCVVEMSEKEEKEREQNSSATAAGASSSTSVTLPGLTLLQPVQTKKLSSSLTIQAVRTLLEKAFKIPAHAKALYQVRYREREDGENQTMEEPLKSLNYYQVQNGGYLMLVRTK